MEVALYRSLGESGWDQPLPTAQIEEQVLVLVFASTPAAALAAPLEQLLQGLPGAVVMGCSTSGQIIENVYLETGLVAAVIRFERSSLKLRSEKLSQKTDSFTVGESLAQQFDAPELNALFVLSEGLNVNASRLMLGFNSVIAGRVPITGGLAGDGDCFQSTWIWVDGRPVSDHVAVLGIYGDSLNLGYASGGGWDVLGPEREITRSQGKVLYEVDGEPALAMYKKYLGKMADRLPASGTLFPLALSCGEDTDEYKVRGILSVNEEDQSISFAGDMPQHSHVRLMRTDYDHLVEAAGKAASSLHLPRRQPRGELLCIAISCVGRRLVLGPRVEDEIEAVFDSLPPGTRQIGFYSHGELSPLASGLCDLHNQTMTLTLWWEE